MLVHLFHVKHCVYWGFLSNLSNPSFSEYSDYSEYSELVFPEGLGVGLYLPISTSNTLMSEGDTPGMRDACAKVSGSILISFCRASVERDLMFS